jgi:hypothetical protein
VHERKLRSALEDVDGRQMICKLRRLAVRQPGQTPRAAERHAVSEHRDRASEQHTSGWQVAQPSQDHSCDITRPEFLHQLRAPRVWGDRSARDFPEQLPQKERVAARHAPTRVDESHFRPTLELGLDDNGDRSITQHTRAQDL